MSAVYSPHSFGHWSGTSHNAHLRVALPAGWPHGYQASDLRPANPFPMLPGNDELPFSHAGRVVLEIALPNHQQAQAGDRSLRVTTLVSTTQQGLHLNRAPTADEMKALRAAWWSIRDAALLEHDAQDEFSEFLDRAEAVAAFARVEPLFLAQRWHVVPERKGYAPVLITVQQPASGTSPSAPAPTAPPLPVMPSSLPKASELPSATDFQKAFQQAIDDARGELSCIGNGYAWAVLAVLGRFEGVLASQIPGFSLDDYRFGRDDSDDEDDDA